MYVGVRALFLMYTWIKEASILKIGIYNEGAEVSITFDRRVRKGTHKGHEFYNTPAGEKDLENHSEELYGNLKVVNE